MKHQHARKPFQHAASRRRTRSVVIISGAFLAMAATAGILLNDTHTPATAHSAPDAVIVDAALSTPNADSQSTPQSTPQAIPPATTAPAPKPPQATPPATTAPASKPPQATAPAPKPPSEKIATYEFQYQLNYYYCGPASTRIALTSHGIKLSQDELARQLHTTTNGTNSAEDTTRVLNSVIGKNLYQTRSIPGPGASQAEIDRLQADAVRAISTGNVIVANIAGGTTDVAGVWHEFPGGHYITIVGYRDDGRTVQIADPSGMFGPSTYWVSTSKMTNWMASHGYSA